MNENINGLNKKKMKIKKKYLNVYIQTKVIKKKKIYKYISLCYCYSLIYSEL